DTGTTTLLAAGYGSSPVVAGNNGYAIMDLTVGVPTSVSFTGTPPAGGDFRLGIAFSDSNHVMGTATGGTYRYSSFSGSSGTLVGSGTVGANERLMAVAIIAGTTILAEQSTADSHVSIYDFSNPLAPI